MIRWLLVTGLASTMALAQGTPAPQVPLFPLAPYLPPAPKQGFLWAGTLKINLRYDAPFKGENSTSVSSSGTVTREKRGHEELGAVINLVDAALKACDWKCNPAVGNVQFNSYFIERFISETNELCGNTRIKSVRMATQERFTLGADGQQGQTIWNLTARDVTPRVEWNSVQQVWMLWLNPQPLMTPLRFYSKAESIDCSGSHPEAPIQHLLNSPVPLPSLILLKNQTMTFQNTLSGQTSVPVAGLDGQEYRVNVTYQLRLVPLNTK